MAWCTFSLHEKTDYVCDIDFRERDALNRVNELRQEEQKRIEEKEKKHQTFLRKQIIEDLHDDLVQNVVQPLKVWTGEKIRTHIVTPAELISN